MDNNELMKKTLVEFEGIKDHLSDIIIESHSDDNSVSIKMSCTYKVKAINMSPAAIEKANHTNGKASLEASLSQAIERSLHQVQLTVQEEINNFARGSGYVVSGE